MGPSGRRIREIGTGGFIWAAHPRLAPAAIPRTILGVVVMRVSPPISGPLAVGAWGLAALLVASATPAGARADGQSRDIDLDTFSPIPRTVPGLLALDSPEIGETADWSMGVFFHHAYEPLLVRSSPGDGADAEGPDRPVVHRSVTELASALALGPLELGFSLPFIHQSGRDPQFSGIEPADGPTLGNLRLRGKVSVLEVEPLALGWAAEVGLPTSQRGMFAGAGSPSLRSQVLLGVREGRAHVVVNAGATFREEQALADAEQGNELNYGLGASYEITDEVAALAEVTGALGLDARSTEGVSPLEARAALRYWPEGRVGLIAGVGRGLMPGVGSPRFRGFALVTLSPGGTADARDLAPPEERVADSKDAPGGPVAVEEEAEPFECREGDRPEDGCPEGEGSLVVLAGDRLESFQSVKFREDSAEILPESFNLLAHIAATLREDREIASLTIEGHVHPSGNEQADRQLAGERAEAVKAWLAERGVEEERLRARGRGGEVPLVEGDEERAREVNERLEFHVEQRGVEQSGN